ncbi:putative uncharacterized protein YDL057W [Silene latifolia]|uniref:putative uncharacterized protein YDL057W n=1 Tax=Silene latifolia TaxID=37657 RepID=UPI003D783D47
MLATPNLRSFESFEFVRRASFPNNASQFQHSRFFTYSPTFRFPNSLTMALNPARQPQKMIVLNDQNEKLVGLLHDTGSQEIVILCHGFRSSKEQRLMVSTAVALENEGISAFRFDFSGNGESDGSFAYGNYMKEVEDLCAVVKHLKGTNRSVTAIVGHSKGGDVVLLYASKYHDVRTIVNLSGRYDLKKGISERIGETFMEKLKSDGYIDVKSKTTETVLYRVTYESLMERWNTDMHESSLKIDKECRVLTVHGSADEIIPVEDANEFAKVIPNHKLHIIEGANHSYTEHQDQLVPVVVDFIKACLEQDKETCA